MKTNFYSGKTNPFDRKKYNKKDKNPFTRCTADVKQCPDGSYVGRVGPNCTFAPCPRNGEETQTEPEKNLPTQENRQKFRDKYPKPEDNPPYQLEDSADDSTLNRMVQLKSFNDTDIIQGEDGKIFLDKANSRILVYINGAWVKIDTSAI